MSQNATPEVILNDDNPDTLNVESREFSNPETRECNTTTFVQEEEPAIIVMIRAYGNLIETSRKCAESLNPGDASVIMAFAAQANTVANLFVDGLKRLADQKKAQDEAAASKG